MGATDTQVTLNHSLAKSRPKASKYLPTDRTTFAKQLDILRGFAAASGPNNKPVTNTDVAELVKMAATTTSMSNAFFQDVGFVTKTDSGFLPSAEVVAYAHAYEWNPDTAAHKLAPLIEQSWFCQALLPKLRYSVIAEDDAIQALAEAAFVPLDKKPQLLMLLSYLSASGIVVQDNGQVRKGRVSSSGAAPAEPTNNKGPNMNQDPPTDSPNQPPTKTGVSTAFLQSTEGLVQFHVSVKVNMNEFKGWEPTRIQAFFSGIAQVLAAKGKIEESAT